MYFIDSIKDFLIQGIGAISTFSPRIWLFLFLICLIGEALNIFVPFLFETTLLMVGYYISKGTLSFLDLFFLLLATELGRLVGAYVLYTVGRGGTVLLDRFKNRLKMKTNINDLWLAKLFNRMNLLNPFFVAAGRLLWLRIPLTLILSARRQLKTLLLAVILSTLVYDGGYIIIGAVVGTTIDQEPIRLLPYLLAGLTGLFLVTFLARRLLAKLFGARRKSGDNSLKV
jgi:membrane protein DedA with SNARE-associated domain